MMQFLHLAVGILSGKFLFSLMAVKGMSLAAIPSYAGSASYGESATSHLDLSDELSAVLLADVFFLGRIPVKGEAFNVDHYWVEDTLNATTVTLNAITTASDTSWTFVSTTGLAVGSLLMDVGTSTTPGSTQPSGTQPELIQVVTVTNTTTCTVVRAVGDSAPAGQVHQSGALMRVVGSPKQEGDETVTDLSVTRARKQNTCQIFKKEVAISGTQMAIHMAGVPDEYNYQLAHRTLEIRRDLGISVMLSNLITAGGSGGSATVIRSMDGLRNRLRPQTAQVDTTSTAFSEELINQLYRKVYNQGAEANFAVGTANQMTKFSELYKDKVRLSPSDRQRGVFVTKYLTDLGVELDLIIDRWALDSDVILGDEKRMRLVPLRGRAWQALPLAKQGDTFRGMIVGEYTAEWRNIAQAFSGALALSL